VTSKKQLITQIEAVDVSAKTGAPLGPTSAEQHRKFRNKSMNNPAAGAFQLFKKRKQQYQFQSQNSIATANPPKKSGDNKFKPQAALFMSRRRMN